MKSTTQQKTMESKLLSQVKSVPKKTMGTGSTPPHEGKVQPAQAPLRHRRIPHNKYNKKFNGRNKPPDKSHVYNYISALRLSPSSGESSSSSVLSSGLAGSLLSLNTVYPVRFAQMHTYPADSAGVVAFSEPVDPSASGQNFAEYGTWTTLFNQVRVRSFKISIAPINSTSLGVALNYPGLIAGCLTTLGVPTSLQSLAENADSKFYPWEVMTHQLVHTLKFNPKPLWADITTPDPGDNIGTPGCIMGFMDGLPISSDAFRVFVEGVYEFRSRT